MPAEGRYIIAVLGCDLAADPIGRQEPISHVLKAARVALGPRPDLLLIAVPHDTGDEIRDGLVPVLNGSHQPSNASIDTLPPEAQHG